MLERIKKLLGIQDNLQDDVLDIIIENVTSHLQALLGREIPTELNFIIEEITIRRFNRLGSEGYKSDNVEGHNVTFYDLKDEFTPYEEVINAHKDDTGIVSRGKVLFL